MLFADDGFAEERGDDRDVGFFGQFGENILHSEAVHLDVRNDDGLDSAVDKPDGILDGGAEHFQVAGFMNFERAMMGNPGHLDHVPRQFDIDGALVTEAGMKNAIDFLEGSLRVAEHGGSDGELLEDFLLGIELADFVMKQRVFVALANAGGAANDDDGTFFGKSASGGVGNLEPTDAIGDADGTESADPRVGIGSKASALFIAGVDGLERAVLEKIVKSKDVIARN